MHPSSEASASPAGAAPPHGESPAALRTSHLWTTEEIAQLLRVDPSTVRRWRAEQPPQGPPFIRLSGRVVLYDTHDLHDWLDERRTTPGHGQKAA
ncbi:helix-turn-helix domain-containing protein [Streptomyces sp. NBC_01476]|uniref:helix-turn-helix transcriptional regulator n=1 Tax=Streptomyces sp. NBC_01476 TaxID=2903881 RepID=UPI002E34CFC4|nr:helix-turn-helix domain-containing protein [Streptomyces sp. NBC_01476]